MSAPKALAGCPPEAGCQVRLARLRPSASSTRARPPRATRAMSPVAGSAPAAREPSVPAAAVGPADATAGVGAAGAARQAPPIWRAKYALDEKSLWPLGRSGRL